MSDTEGVQSSRRAGVVSDRLLLRYVREFARRAGRTPRLLRHRRGPPPMASTVRRLVARWSRPVHLETIASASEASKQQAIADSELTEATRHKAASSGAGFEIRES